MLQTYIVGIDGGGTKVKAAAFIKDADQSLKNVAEYQAGPCNIAYSRGDEASNNALSAIEGLGIEQSAIGAISIGVAGFSFSRKRVRFEKHLRTAFPDIPIFVLPDFKIGFRAAFPDETGIIIIAGTGSVVYASNKRLGKSHRVGGYGYRINDAGSGVGVGREALSAVMQALDGSGTKTTLTNRVFEALKISAWDDAISKIYAPSFNPVSLASLAEVVAKAANEDHDEVASRILMHAGGALARLAETAYSHVFDQNEPFRIAQVGSLWKSGECLTTVFERSCARFAPHSEISATETDPAYGAALIAAGQVNVADAFAHSIP